MIRHTILIASCVVASGATVARAAPVSWGGAFEVTSPSDLRISGRRVVYAVNGGDSVGNLGNPVNAPGGPAVVTSAGPDPLVVNVGSRSVAFQSLGVRYGSGSTFVQDTYGDVISHRSGQNRDVSFEVVSERGTNLPLAGFDLASSALYSSQRVYSADSGDPAFDSLLASQVFTDGRIAGTSKLKVSLNNLTPGVEYQVQVVIGADSRPARGSTIERSLSVYRLNDNLGNLSPNLPAYGDLDADSLSHVTSVVGSFTADGVSQLFDVDLVTGRNPAISAILLTTVPEPGFVATLGLVALPLLRRRK